MFAIGCTIRTVVRSRLINCWTGAFYSMFHTKDHVVFANFGQRFWVQLHSTTCVKQFKEVEHNKNLSWIVIIISSLKSPPWCNWLSAWCERMRENAGKLILAFKTGCSAFVCASIWPELDNHFLMADEKAEVFLAFKLKVSFPHSTCWHLWIHLAKVIGIYFCKFRWVIQARELHTSLILTGLS